MLDVRFKDDEECTDVFEQCCELEKIKEKNETQFNLNSTLHQVTNITGKPNQCGKRNKKGLLFGIKGAFKGESQFGEKKSRNNWINLYEL